MGTVNDPSILNEISEAKKTYEEYWSNPDKEILGNIVQLKKDWLRVPADSIRKYLKENVYAPIEKEKIRREKLREEAQEALKTYHSKWEQEQAEKKVAHEKKQAELSIRWNKKKAIFEYIKHNTKKVKHYDGKYYINGFEPYDFVKSSYSFDRDSKPKVAENKEESMNLLKELVKDELLEEKKGLFYCQQIEGYNWREERVFKEDPVNFPYDVYGKEKEKEPMIRDFLGKDYWLEEEEFWRAGLELLTLKSA